MKIAYIHEPGWSWRMKFPVRRWCSSCHNYTSGGVNFAPIPKLHHEQQSTRCWSQRDYREYRKQGIDWIWLDNVWTGTQAQEWFTWYTPVGILRFTPGDKWAAALRCEYYSDKNNVIISAGTPNGFQTLGGSVNIDYLPVKNIALRLEGRHLKSKDPIFQKDGSETKTNTMITFSTAINF